MKINFVRALALSLGVMGYGGAVVADELISTPVETASFTLSDLVQKSAAQKSKGKKAKSDASCDTKGAGKVKFDWGANTSLSIGAGLRTSYNAIEGGNSANGGTAQDFALNNARIYLNGKGHERIGFEFNTDIDNAQGFNLDGTDEGASVRILDLIAKFQLTDHISLWTGRFLPPSDRSNLDGPFYLNAWNFPWVQFGHPNIFQGRDDGAALFGQYGDGAFKWQVGAFEGDHDGSAVRVGNADTDNLMVTGRLTLNLLDPEPGYYNASTYYGEKDILAVGVAFMHRHNALQDATTAGVYQDQTSWSIDGLFERPLDNGGVMTVEGAYYNNDDHNGVRSPGNEVLIGTTRPRTGDGYFILGSYLFPNAMNIMSLEGKLQFMTRYMEYTSESWNSGQDNQTDFQLNYIMNGHNARISAVWSVYDDHSGTENTDTFTLGTQLQF